MNVTRLNKVVLVLCLVFALGLIGFAVNADSSGGTLRVALRGDITTLDPAHMLDSQSSRVGEQVYDNLLTYDKAGDIVPELAHSWEWSEDGKKLTLFLREDVKFTDGTEFNASAVKFNYDRVMDPDVASYNMDLHVSGIDAVEVVDNYTVRFHLPERNAAFIPTHIINDENYMISPKSVEEHGYEDTGVNGIGTGPFKFVEYRDARHVKLERNEDYWGGAPRLQEVIFKPIPEREAAVIELRTGGVDLLLGLTQEGLKQVAGEEDIVVSKAPNPSIRGLWFQMENFPPFSNKNVRKAFIHSLPRTDIVESFLGDTAVSINTMLPIESWAYDPDVASYEHDVEKAEKLLEEEGWVDQDGDGIREKDGQALEFTITTPDGRYLGDKEISEAALYAWEQIGANIKIEVLEWGAWMDAVFGPEPRHEMVFMGWLQRTLDPTAFIDDLASTGGPGNVHNYSNETLDAILEKAASIPNPEIRQGMYYSAQQILHDEAMWIPLYNAMGIGAHHESLKGYEYSPYDPIDFTEAYFEG